MLSIFCRADDVLRDGSESQPLTVGELADLLVPSSKSRDEGVKKAVLDCRAFEVFKAAVNGLCASGQCADSAIIYAKASELAAMYIGKQ